MKLRKATRDFVCYWCDGKIKDGEQYFYSGKRYHDLCYRQKGWGTYKDSLAAKIIRLIDVGPVFHDELDDDRCRNLHIVMRRMRGSDITFFRWNGGRGKHIPPPFMIIYREEDAIKAYKRIVKRYDVVRNSWKKIGIPIVGRENIVRDRGGAFRLKGDEK